MNIKKLIVPIGSLIVIIIALIIGVATLNRPVTNNSDTTVKQAPQINIVAEAQLKEADAAYQKGDYDAALTILEKVRTTYQDHNKTNEADAVNDKIQSIKALKQQESATPNDNASKTPAPIAE